MRRVGAYPIRVKLPYPMGLLSQREEMVVAELFVAKTVPRKCIKTLQRSNVLSKLKEQA
jgi:hypothetical protein